MAHHKSTIKRIRTTRKENLLNRQYRSRVRTLMKRVTEVEDEQVRKESLARAGTLLDRLARKGIIHRNTAARRKSRLAKFVNQANKPTDS